MSRKHIRNCWGLSCGDGSAGVASLERILSFASFENATRENVFNADEDGACGLHISVMFSLVARRR